MNANVTRKSLPSEKKEKFLIYASEIIAKLVADLGKHIHPKAVKKTYRRDGYSASLAKRMSCKTKIY